MKKAKDMAWGALLHLGTNMWGDKTLPVGMTYDEIKKNYRTDHLLLDEGVWNEAVSKMVDAGMNMVVLDLGEAVVYPSCPQLAVKGAWTPDRLKAELKRLRGLGLEPIPKLNFSATHDTWLGEYHRMVSTPEYYHVCAGIIRDVSEMFDCPRLLHIGYDEEGEHCQKDYEFAVVRQGELWWHDFLWFVNEVEKNGMRSWIWSDYYWNHGDEFLKRMPRSVVQSNWYYGASLEWPYNESSRHVANAFKDLDKAGFDQIPCGSNWGCRCNFAALVYFCREYLDPDRVLGFLTAPWVFTTPAGRQRLLESIDQVKRVLKGEYAWN